MALPISRRTGGTVDARSRVRVRPIAPAGAALAPKCVELDMHIHDGTAVRVLITHVCPFELPCQGLVVILDSHARLASSTPT